MSRKYVGLCLLATGLLAGCGNFFGDSVSGETDTDAIQRAEDPYHTDPKYADLNDYNPKTQEGKDTPGVMGMLFGSGKTNNGGGGGGGGFGGPGFIGVNSYLWRATLDTVSFMPLSSADPFGGVIITDWYSPPDAPNERFKVNIFILGRELRADGLRASVFRQRRDPGGQWIDANVDKGTGTDIENAILTRARQMRMSTAANQ